jgi:hypothetical protein
MFEISAHHAGGHFRLQRQAGVTAIFEGIHLFFDDIRARADAARIDPRLLEDRRLDALIAIALARLAHDGLYQLPGGREVGQDVARPLHRFEGGHAKTPLPC